MSFFPAFELGKSCRCPCNSLASALPHLPGFCTDCASCQHLVKGNPKRQECRTATHPWDLLPLPHTHTHTHTRSFSLQECPQAMGGLLKVNHIRRALRNWSDSSSLLPRSFQGSHSLDAHVFAWILLGHKAAGLTREPAQHVCFPDSPDTAFPFCDGGQFILAASQVCKLTPSVVKDFKVKSPRNPTRRTPLCRAQAWHALVEVNWTSWWREPRKGREGGWASRKKGEDLKLEEDNEQGRASSRYKCRTILSRRARFHRVSTLSRQGSLPQSGQGRRRLRGSVPLPLPRGAGAQTLTWATLASSCSFFSFPSLLKTNSFSSVLWSCMLYSRLVKSMPLCSSLTSSKTFSRDTEAEKARSPWLQRARSKPRWVPTGKPTSQWATRLMQEPGIWSPVFSGQVLQ